MAKKDYYDLLGVQKTADEAALKAAYRKKAMEFHPDRNPDNKDAEAKFKEINEAYEILKDPQKRGAYDQYGHAAFEQGGGGGQGGFHGGFDFGGGGGMGDIFEELFGMGGRGRRSNGGRERGADLRYNMEISLEEAYQGKTASLKIPTAMSCEACTGSGAEAGSKPKTCTTCQGAGQVRSQQGFFSQVRTCPACHGRGQVIEKPCKKCAGAGRTTKERTLSVNIPQGVEEGTRIRLSNEGEAGMRGGPNGDLYIFISLATHGFFQRDGADLYCRVPISFVTASLGGTVEVPVINGSKMEVKVPASTKYGTRLRLTGKGMPILRSKNFGDMYVQVEVETPKNLTPRQKELLKEFEKESSKDTNPESAGFFAKAKGFWGG
jgi:molecular chaperone DnaJ